MTISSKDLRLLYQRSGNRCAFPTCPQILTEPETELDDPAVLSEVAHIVARSIDGPRGHDPLPIDERDIYENLILLCEKHHTIVDTQWRTYTVERLRQIKADHEARIQAVTDQISVSGQTTELIKKETLFSTLLPVVSIPRYVYGVSSQYNDQQERVAAVDIVAPANKSEIYPFIIRGGMLYCFQDLRDPHGPFQKLTQNKNAHRFSSLDWWKDPDCSKWYVSLLNRSLNKLTGRKGLNLDRRHNRYYFQPPKAGESLEITYRSLNRTSTKRQVVWQPITKKTGIPKSYWYHQAVALQFHQISRDNWCLSIRPEFHITKDGFASYDSDAIGSKVTRKIAHMFNYDYLGEIQFWRDFLSDGRRRIIMPFGRGQQIIVSTNIMQTKIEWPGIPEEYAKSFKNIEYQDDLFSWAELNQLELAKYEEDEDEWGDLDDDL
jgi:hypothetical protein